MHNLSESLVALLNLELPVSMHVWPYVKNARMASSVSRMHVHFKSCTEAGKELLFCFLVSCLIHTQHSSLRCTDPEMPNVTS